MDALLTLTNGPSVPATTNFIINPGFHEDTTGWTPDVLNVNGILTVSNERSLFGRQSMFLWGANTEPVAVQITASGLEVGETYVASFYYYAPLESGGSLVSRLRNSAGTTLVGGIAFSTRGEWARAYLSAVAPADGVIIVSIGSLNPAGGATINFVDGVQLEKGTTPTPYCDGYEPRCRWTGDANASTSKRDEFVGTTVSLLSDADTETGFYLSDWKPQVAQYKDGGIESSSPFADGTRLRHKQFNSVIETFNLRAKNIDTDTIARQMSAIRRSLEDASDYWAEPFNKTPWWVAARAPCETNTRYAYIQQGSIAEDTAPYSQPFLQPRGRRVTDELSLIIKRGHWLSQPPPESEDLTLCSQSTYQTSYALDFAAASTDRVNCASDASIDDLPLAAVTAEAWVKVDSGTANQRIIDKGASIFLYTGATGQLITFHSSGGTAPAATSSEVLLDGSWHHVAMTYDDAGTRTPRLWIDGVEVTYLSQITATGVLNSDAAASLALGNLAAGTAPLDGQMGWVRLSDIIRYTETFIPPDRCFPPTLDNSTVAMYNFREGTGTTLTDATANNNDGTITGADWVDGCETCTGNRLNVPIVYALDYDGADFSAVYDPFTAHTALHDLPTNGFCVDAWIKYDGVVSVDNTGRIFERGSYGSNPHWGFYVDDTHVAGRLGAVVQTVGTDASVESIENINDGKWHHVAMQYTGTATGFIYLWIDGVQVTYYAYTQSTGAYVSDVGNDTFFGNDNLAGRGFVGKIAWMRISNITRFDSSSGFTPFPLCSPPGQDDKTVALYYANEGDGNLLIDKSFYDNNATIVGAEWADNCAVLGTDEDDCGCLDNYEYTPAVVTGFHKLAGLTNIHKSPTPPVAARQTNLLGEELPYHLLPDNVSDTQLYIGIDSTLFGSGNEGVFNNVVFYLTVPYTGTVTWEYYNAVGAAWTAMTTFITGDVNLDKHGLNIISWPQPAGMTSAASVIGLPAGVYIRATFSAANEADVIQDKQQVYTASQPYLDIVEDFGGDIASLIGLTFVGNGERFVKTAIHSIICGARDVSRGENFQMILPFGDSQLPDNVSTTNSGGGIMSFGATVASPTYTCQVFTPGAAGVSGTATIQIEPPLAGEYTGRFVPAMRFWLDENGGAGPGRSSAIQSYKLEVKVGTTSSEPIYSRTVTPTSELISGQLIQDRKIVWPEIFIDPRAFVNMLDLLFEVTVTQVTAAISNIYLTDFALIPSDEMIFGISGNSILAVTEVLENDDWADVTSIEYPNYGTLARATNQKWTAYIPKYNGPAELSLKKARRLWFWINSRTDNFVNGGYGIFGVLSTTYMRRVRRYLSLRGDE